MSVMSVLSVVSVLSSSELQTMLDRDRQCWAIRFQRSKHALKPAACENVLEQHHTIKPYTQYIHTKEATLTFEITPGQAILDGFNEMYDIQQIHVKLTKNGGDTHM
jgi:hypothetical protein